MNIVFWVLVFILVVAIWYLLSAFFGPIGGLFKGMWDDVLDEIKGTERSEEEKWTNTKD